MRHMVTTCYSVTWYVVDVGMPFENDTVDLIFFIFFFKAFIDNCATVVSAAEFFENFEDVTRKEGNWSKLMVEQIDTQIRWCSTKSTFATKNS